MRGFSPEQAGKAAVHAFDLASGETIGKWDADLQPALLNDLTIATEGGVYVTDSLNGRVLTLDTETGSWTSIGVGVDYIGPNGLSLSGTGETLFVADFLGLTRIDLATGEAKRLLAPSGVRSLGGIDGLSYTSGSLVAIQNVVGTGRVWRVNLDKEEHELAGIELLEAGHPAFRNPTTGVVVGEDYLFLANPGLQRAIGGKLEPLPEGGRLKLLRLPLTPSERGENAEWMSAERKRKAAFSRSPIEGTATLAPDQPRDDDDLRQLKAASDAWWKLWLPPEAADLDLAATLEGSAAGFGYFGNNLRSIEEISGWKTRMRTWLDTLETLEYSPIGRTFRVVAGTGLEWGHYRERQVKKGGEVRRDHQGRYSLTWVRMPQGWRIVSYHRSALPDER